MTTESGEIARSPTLCSIFGCADRSVRATHVVPEGTQIVLDAGSPHSRAGLICSVAARLIVREHTLNLKEI